MFEELPLSRIVAVTREEVYSPGKVEADRAILQAVVDALAMPISVVRGEDVAGETPTLALVMCQGPRAMGILARWHLEGATIVNTPEAIGRTFSRLRMLESLRRGGVPMPAYRVVPTGDEEATGWVKRCDVHAEGPGDVSRAPGALASFNKRGIAYAVVQEHVEGREAKFYGVGERVWGPPDVADAARRAAAALGLDVYGGDAILDGETWRVIDVNDWPSFSSCRAEAAGAVAALVRSKL